MRCDIQASLRHLMQAYSFVDNLAVAIHIRILCSLLLHRSPQPDSSLLGCQGLEKWARVHVLVGTPGKVLAMAQKRVIDVSSIKVRQADMSSKFRLQSVRGHLFKFA